MKNENENYETFFKRIRGLFSPAEENKIKLAYILAKAGHRGQFRKELKNGKPLRYFEHPRRVALIILDELNLREADMISASLLHDALEDIKMFTPEMIETYFNKKVCLMVKLLTKTCGDIGDKRSYWQNLERYGDWRTLIIKTCDRLDNLRSLKDTEVSFIAKQIKETQEFIYPLMDKLLISSPHKDKVIYLKNAIYDQVNNLLTNR